MTSLQMELWSDNENTEFAIFLNSNPVVKTNDKVKFTTKIAQASYFDGYKKNWEQIIDKWIIFYFSDKYAREFAPSINTNQGKSLKFSSSQRPSARRRPRIKCNFCGLKFRFNNDRREHELVWHRKGMNRQANNGTDL